MDTASDRLVGERFPELMLLSTTGVALTPADFADGAFVLFIYPRLGARTAWRRPSGRWSRVPRAVRRNPANSVIWPRTMWRLDTASMAYPGRTPPTSAKPSPGCTFPIPLLSDPGFTLATALGLPTFDVAGERLHVRSTLVVLDGTIV